MSYGSYASQILGLSVLLPISIWLSGGPLHAAGSKISWEHVNPFPTSQHLRSIAYGNGVWVVLGYNVVLTSSDLVQWTTMHIPQAFPQARTECLGSALSEYGVCHHRLEFQLHTFCLRTGTTGGHVLDLVFGNAFAAYGNGISLVGSRDVPLFNRLKDFPKVSIRHAG